MKLIYEAPNSIEGHMILNLLEQASLSARIDGEYLQGGVGELQAIGLVRVMVDEEDYAEAKTIIDAWDTAQPEQQPQQQQAMIKQSSFAAGLVGFVVGVIVMTVYFGMR